MLKVATLGLVSAELGARAGAGPVSFVSRRRWAVGERAALGFLLGWAVCGAALLGVAAVGLLSWPVVLLVTVGLAGAGRSRSGPRLVVVGLLNAAAGGTWWSRCAMAGAMLPAVASLPLADLSWDSGVYHLGYAWQCLQIHRLPVDAVPIPFWTPLPVDLAMAVPLLLGDERCARTIVLLHLLALAALWQERCRRERIPDAGWLGIVLVLAGGLVPGLLTTCKNDIPAAALCTAGGLLAMRGAWGVGGALLGAGVAAKFVVAPAMACWVLAFPPRSRRLRPLSFVILALPVLPWLTRSWLAAGHLGFPYMFSGTSAWNWTTLNQAVFRFFQDQLGALNRNATRGQTGTWLVQALREAPAVAVALAALVAARITRRAGGALLVGVAATFWLGRLAKYVLPAHLTALLMAAGLLATRHRRAPRWLPHLVGTAAVLAGWASPVWRDLPWRDVAARWPLARARAETSFEETLAAVGRSGARRVLTIGDWRTYRIPARVLYGGISGETPVVRTLALEARDLRQLRKRWRQLGADAVLLNVVSTEWLEVRYSPFAWNPRMIRLHVDFCRGYLAETWRSATCDTLNGGFYLYDLLDRPRAPLARTTWFAPGLEPVFGTGTRLLTLGDSAGASTEFRRVLDVMPEVGQAWNKVGHALMVSGNVAAALPYLRRFGDQGMVDAINLPELGVAAYATGDRALAERVFTQVLIRYPGHPLTRGLLKAADGDPRRLHAVLLATPAPR